MNQLNIDRTGPASRGWCGLQTYWSYFCGTRDWWRKTNTKREWSVWMLWVCFFATIAKENSSHINTDKTKNSFFFCCWLHWDLVQQCKASPNVTIHFSFTKSIWKLCKLWIHFRPSPTSSTVHWYGVFGVYSLWLVCWVTVNASNIEVYLISGKILFQLWLTNLFLFDWLDGAWFFFFGQIDSDARYMTTTFCLLIIKIMFKLFFEKKHQTKTYNCISFAVGDSWKLWHKTKRKQNLATIIQTRYFDSLSKLTTKTTKNHPKYLISNIGNVSCNVVVNRQWVPSSALVENLVCLKWHTWRRTSWAVWETVIS